MPIPRKEVSYTTKIDSTVYADVNFVQDCDISLTVEEEPCCPFFPGMSAGLDDTLLLAELSHGTLLK